MDSDIVVFMADGTPGISWGLVLQVLEAVLEVVCISLPGYIAARAGVFDTITQKSIANLNMTLFTPCLSNSSSPTIPQKRLTRSASFLKAG